MVPFEVKFEASRNSQMILTTSELLEAKDIGWSFDGAHLALCTSNVAIWERKVGKLQPIFSSGVFLSKDFLL